MAIPEEEGGIFDFDYMHPKIVEMVKRLKSDEIGFKKIWYPPLETNFSVNRRYDSSTALLIQLSKFKQSKRVLFILPYPMISSVFVEIGWAMMSDKDKPVLMIANREGLPFLVKKVDTLKDRNIYLASWEEIGGIKNIPDWILDNNYHKIPINPLD